MKSTVPFALILLILWVIFSPAWSQFRKVATTGYAFLEIPVSAREAALGETSTTFANPDAAAVFANPGMLGFIQNQHAVHGSFANYLVDTRHQALAYVYRHPSLGSFALSVNQLDMGEMVETVNADPLNPGGNYLVLGTFKADALAIGLSYARRLTDLFAFGITTKYIREQIARYQSENIIFDVGMMYYTGFRSLRIGGYIQNFGVDSKYLDDTFKMPMVFKLGGSMELWDSPLSRQRLTLCLDALHPSNYSERVHSGVEYSYRNMLILRVGYKFNYDLGGFTAGCGLNWPGDERNLGIDFSYTDFDELESVMRFSLNLSF